MAFPDLSPSWGLFLNNFLFCREKGRIRQDHFLRRLSLCKPACLCTPPPHGPLLKGQPSSHSSLPAAASSTSFCQACILGPLAQEVWSPRSTPGHSPTRKSQSPFPGEPDLREEVSQAQEMCNWYPISSSISFPPLSPLNLQIPPLLSIYTSSNPSHIKT